MKYNTLTLILSAKGREIHIIPRSKTKRVGKPDAAGSQDLQLKAPICNVDL